MFSDNDVFGVRCPHCDKTCSYEHSEVKQTLPLDWRKQEAEILALKAENFDLKHKLLTIGRAVTQEHGILEDSTKVKPTKQDDMKGMSIG